MTKDLSKLYDDFLNPGPEYRGKPFWSWNGKLEKDELLRQIHVMKEMGFGGFFMHSRTGLVTEYLGEEWFEMINACSDEAEKLGMEAWLYDEDRFPSGIAGGLVTVEPLYRMKSVRLSIYPAKEFEWDEDIFAAFSCKLDGVNYTECKRIKRDSEGCIDAGAAVLVFRIVEMDKHSVYNGYTYLDTLNRKATDRFIELTHEKYKDKCGDKFNKVIKGIFTDEPHRGALMDTFGSERKDDFWRAPWTDNLPEEFKKKFGYDLIEKLPELFLKEDGKLVSQVKWNFVELLMQMFLDNFLIPINEWCKKNSFILTGHLLHEDSLTAQTVMCGSIMRCYEHMEYPGVDVLTEGNKSFWIVKQLASVARQLGSKWLLSELYGCTGWQMDFEAHKAVGVWQALFGINLRCHHLSFYTMEGEAKRDYPASIFHQSSWWKEYKYVEDYFSRIGLVMSEGKPCCDVLVLNPVESLWCQVYPGWAKYLEAVSPEVNALEEQYRSIFHWLSGEQIDFDYGDEDILARHAIIEQDNEGNARLRVGKALYKVVIVSGMLTIRSSTLKTLENFINLGGTVIFAGDPPAYKDAIESRAAYELAEKAENVRFECKALTAAVLKYFNNRIVITDSEGINIQDIYCQMRDDGENKYIMLLNVNREKGYDNVTVHLNIKGFVQEWDCSSGKRFSAGETDKEGNLIINTSFEPCRERIFVVNPEKDKDIPQIDTVIEEAVYKLDGEYSFELDEPNICVLDMASCSIDGGNWEEENEILKVDRSIRSRFGLGFRSGSMLQPWFTQKQSHPCLGKIKLLFEFFIESMPEGQVMLVMERPENFKISINGSTLDKSYKNEEIWIDRCFKKLEIAKEMLKSGRNCVEIETVFNQVIDLEALYIIGNFGVRLDGSKKTIVALPFKIKAGDLVRQYLPFYSGKVLYKILVKKNINDSRVFIRVNRFEGACIKVVSPENIEEIIAWPPYEIEITDMFKGNKEIDLEVVLTRRNTFGPLHQIPLYDYAYGPDSFLTEGKRFSKDYMLIPAGLLEAPEIVIKKSVYCTTNF